MIDLVGLANAQGLEIAGPIIDMQDLPKALADAMDRVRDGASLVMDVHIMTEYAASSVQKRSMES